MPIKQKKKSGKGYKYRSFNQTVGDYKKQGMSESSAIKLTAFIDRKQHPKGRKKKK